MDTSLYNDTSVKEVTHNDFNGDKLTIGKEGFLMCYAHWCPHCRKHIPLWLMLSEIVNKKSDFLIASFDCMEENNKKMLQRLNITRFPTMFYFSKDGTLYPFEQEITSDNLVRYINEKR